MKEGVILVFCGGARGKTAAAMGVGLGEAGRGRTVVMVRFMKGRVTTENEVLSRLEPEFSIFSFEKYSKPFNMLTQEERIDEIRNIKNGINYVRKVLSTGQCDLLILDEVLILIENDIITFDELKSIIDLKPPEVKLILTGTVLRDEVRELADEIIVLENAV